MDGYPPTLADAFVPFSTAHWVVFACIAGATAALSWLLRQAVGRRHESAIRRTVCWSLAGVLLVGSCLAELQRAIEGAWSVRESLPLHLCDIAVFVTAGALIGAGGRAAPGGIWQWLYELAWVWGIAGTSQAVLTPDLAVGFPNSECVRYFALHGTIVVSVLVLTLGLRMHPQPGAPWRVWWVTLALAVAILPVNWALGANYMYLCGPPAHPSLFDYFGPWPWSLLSLAVAGTALILLCCAPFWWLNRRQRVARAPGS
jgi:hypothetical integral membrane protein (TIGR02206 family)